MTCLSKTNKKQNKHKAKPSVLNLKIKDEINKLTESSILPSGPTYTGMPMIMAGIAMPAIKAIPTGAPTKCAIACFFFRLRVSSQKVTHPDGLKEGKITM